MMYVWNCFTMIACCESCLDSVLDRVETTLAELTLRGERDQAHRRYFYDDLCLAMLIKGVCLRHKRNVDDALNCFQFIISQWVPLSATLRCVYISMYNYIIVHPCKLQLGWFNLPHSAVSLWHLSSVQLLL